MTPAETVRAEARLLDAHDLPGWLALLTPDVRYTIPPFGMPDADPRTTLFLLADDADRLASRVAQLRRLPRVTTRRSLGEVDVEGEVARVGFRLRVVRPDRSRDYSGTIVYRFAADGRICRRRVLLDDPIVERLDFIL